MTLASRDRTPLHPALITRLVTMLIHGNDDAVSQLQIKAVVTLLKSPTVLEAPGLRVRLLNLARRHRLLRYQLCSIGVGATIEAALGAQSLKEFFAAMRGLASQQQANETRAMAGRSKVIQAFYAVSRKDDVDGVTLHLFPARPMTTFGFWLKVPDEKPVEGSVDEAGKITITKASDAKSLERLKKRYSTMKVPPSNAPASFVPLSFPQPD